MTVALISSVIYSFLILVVFLGNRSRKRRQKRDLPKLDICVVVPTSQDNRTNIEKYLTYDFVKEVHIVSDEILSHKGIENVSHELNLNDKAFRQSEFLRHFKVAGDVILFLDDDIELTNSVTREVVQTFADDPTTGVLFFAYHQIPKKGNWEGHWHATLFNTFTIPIIEIFRLFFGIPGALGGGLAMKQEAAANLPWEIIRQNITEDIPISNYFKSIGRKTILGANVIDCAVPRMDGKSFFRLWHRWFLGTRLYLNPVPKVLALVLFVLFVFFNTWLMIGLFQIQALAFINYVLYVTFILVNLNVNGLKIPFGSVLIVPLLVYLLIPPLIWAFLSPRAYWGKRSFKLNQKGEIIEVAELKDA